MRLSIQSAILAACLSLAACGDSGGGGNGAQDEANARAVAIMPDFAPLYPGAAVQSSIGTGTGSAATGTVTFASPANPADIIAFYRDKILADGMQEGTDAGGDVDTVIFSAQKPGMAVKVIAAQVAGGANVQVLWAPQLSGE